jgi:hypothetical protein
MSIPFYNFLQSVEYTVMYIHIMEIMEYFLKKLHL